MQPIVRLLPEISFDKRPLPGSGWSFDFRHRSLGALGRILLQDMPGGRGFHVSALRPVPDLPAP